MGRILAIALGATVALGGAAHAQTAFETVFRSGTLDGLSEGAALLYATEGAMGTDPADDWAGLVVDVGPGDAATVSASAEEAEGDPLRPLGRFDARVGNPVAMIFLERTVRAVAEGTGGSPFYIRNRIRDALGGPGEVEAVTIPWGGGEVAATEVTLAPFAQDAHRDELGGFADLVIRVVVSESVPGFYHSIEALAPAASATLTLAGVDG